MKLQRATLAPEVRLISQRRRGLALMSCAVVAATAVAIAVLVNALAIYHQPPKHTPPFKTKQPQEPPTLYGVNVSRSALLKDDLVLSAARFAAAAHEGQARKTGEPYVSHCVEAALIVERNLPRRDAEAGRQRAAVMAALLHDVLDDTPVTYAALEEAFGPQVAGMVAQVSKLSAVNQMLRRDKRRGVVSTDPAYW